MNYLKPELLEQLAAEYVLGTLHSGARRRFEQLMMESYRIRSTVWEWEQHINPIAKNIPDILLPDSIWKGIQQRINPPYFAQTADKQTGWRSLFLWQSWGAVSTAFAIVLALFISLQTPPKVDRLNQVAVFNNEKNEPLWLISSNTETGQLAIKPINAQAVAVDNKAFELWMLPTSGQPRSLGLMPVSGKKQEMVLSPQLLSILQSSQGLAISLEPSGGSLTGLPTGPVVYQAPLIEL